MGITKTYPQTSSQQKKKIKVRGKTPSDTSDELIEHLVTLVYVNNRDDGGEANFPHMQITGLEPATGSKRILGYRWI